MTSEGVDKRARTIQEIIATEKSYVGKLNALIEVRFVGERRVLECGHVYVGVHRAASHFASHL
jgi:hypothetical protein